MYVKLTTSKRYQYVQIVESFRDEKGISRQRVLLNLGRLDKIESIQSVHAGLSRILGVPSAPVSDNLSIKYDKSRALGNVCVLTQLWEQLGLDQFRKVLRSRTRHKIDLESLLRIMVFNRLCDANSKLGALRWVKKVSLPDMGISSVNHQQLLRTMDALIEHRDAVEKVLTDSIRPLISDKLSIIFYDLTSITVEGESELENELRKHGRSKDGTIVRQFLLGLVQTADGIPIYHEVFEGNTSETKTLKGALEKVLSRYSISRVIAVGDRAMLSIENLMDLKAMILPNGKPLEFIVAVPGRRYAEFADLLAPINKTAQRSKKDEIIKETKWQGLRLVVAHNKHYAKEQGAKRDAKIAKLEQQAAKMVKKLDEQASGKPSKGRPLTEAGVFAEFKRAVGAASLGKIIKIDNKSARLSYHIDQKELNLSRAIDGKLLIVSNVRRMRAKDIVERYKSLADIERGFRVLESEIKIGPVYHRLPERIQAHAFICFIALLLHRVMRDRLRKNPIQGVVSPERALEILEDIQTHRITIGELSKHFFGITDISEEQAAIIKSLNVKIPTIANKFVNL